MANRDPGLEMELLMRSVATSKTVVDEGFDKAKGQQNLQRVNQSLESADLGTDDGIPPANPTGVVIQEFMRALAVSWDLPDYGEQVVTTTVEVTRVDGGGTGTPEYHSAPVRDGSMYVPISGLQKNGVGTNGFQPVPASGYNVKVQHKDIHGLVSGWTTPLTRIPNESTVDKIVADKIIAGVLKAAVSVSSGGTISAGGARLDAAGLTLANVGLSTGSPSQGRASWITPPDQGGTPLPYAGIGFFYTDTSTGSDPIRGITIRADGVSGTPREGMIRLFASAGGQSFASASSAAITVRSDFGTGRGFVFLKEDVFVNSDLNVSNTLAVNNNANVRSVLTVGPPAAPQVRLIPDTTSRGNDLLQVLFGRVVLSDGVTLEKNGSGQTEWNSSTRMNSQLQIFVNASAPDPVWGLYPGGSFVGPANIFTSRHLSGASVGTMQLAASAVTQSRISANAVTSTELAPDSVAIAHIRGSLQNPSQGDYGLRTINPLLGGGALGASSGNHSHGSGNSLDFDYLPSEFKQRVFSAREHSRQVRGRVDDMGLDELKEVVKTALYLSSVAIAIEIDAPDLTAEEREAKRQNGEEFGEFFEYRRHDQIQAQKAKKERSAMMGKGTMAVAAEFEQAQRLHDPTLRFYERGREKHPDEVAV